MESRNDLMLSENRHRLLMCCRMARALGKGEIHLDATGPKMFWRMEKDDRTSNIFHSIDEMESFLEHLLENRNRLSMDVRKGFTLRAKQRPGIVRGYYNQRTKREPMMFSSRINRY